MRREDAILPEASSDVLAGDGRRTDSQTPDATAADMAAPDGSPADALTRDAATRDAAAPDSAAPDTAALDAAAPDVAAPDAAVYDAGQPGGLRCVALDCSQCVGLPCHQHPQDAVNAADPGDTIVVYPGEYGPRYYDTRPPHYSDSDRWAPPLIVYKDGLTIQAVDAIPANTVLYNDQGFWSNPVAIQASTGGTWDGANSSYVGAGIYPAAGTSPNAVIVVADNVTIAGLRIYSTSASGAVLIGDLCVGCSQYAGVSDTRLYDCDVSGHSGVTNWKAAGTTIDGCAVDNTSAAPEPHGSAVYVWDGESQLPYVTSRGTQIINSTITATGECGDEGGCRGIYLGGDQDGPVDHSDLYIDGNTITASGNSVFLWNSSGTNKVMTCNNQVTAGNTFQRLVLAGSTFDGPYPCD